MQKSIMETYNLGKALELKLWFDARGNYMVYLGGLPVNIHTGYVAGCDDQPDDLVLNERSEMYNYPTYGAAVQAYEQLRHKYIEN